MSHQSELIASDIQAYLDQHENKDLLRLLTCGSVDDGKSTLIGRLLHDSKMIFEDQLSAIKSDSRKFNTTDQEFDLALLVDGLQSEREQGITIDVAYRYFSTDKRKFIIADCPGHEQYTRNMATGASTCDLAIILIDARKGVQTQTRRHSYIVSLLGIRHVIVAVNKMDLVDYRQDVYRQIKADYKGFAEQLGIDDVRFVPISALRGDNVVDSSEQMSWYPGAPLMKLLETVAISDDKNLEDFRMPVQYVNRPNLDFRGFCGTVAAGVIMPGDEVAAMPSGKVSRVSRIVTAEGDLERAFPGQAITLTLEDEIDVSRGDMLVHASNRPPVADSFQAHLVWMNEDAMQPGREYLFKLASKSVFGQVTKLASRIDVNTLAQEPAKQLQLNEIGLCQIHLNAPVAFDPYSLSQGTGGFIIIDRMSNVTLAAGMIAQALEGEGEEHTVDLTPERMLEFERKMNALVREYFPHWGVRKM